MRRNCLSGKVWGLTALLALGVAGIARADERHFAYSYEADSVLPKGRYEFEQWVTQRREKAAGKFSRWDFREEVEYGITDRLTTALYLNFENVHSEGVPGRSDEDATKFEGISSEWKYMWLSPHLHPVGVLPYFELTVGGDEIELEEKLILTHIFANKMIWAGNIVLEQEWERENGDTEEEAVLELTTGLSVPIGAHWSAGLEGRNHREFPDGVTYEKQEHSAWFLGPNVHYGNEKWWATLTVLPQIHGTPDTRKGLFLDEHEKTEVRLVAAVFF